MSKRGYRTDRSRLAASRQARMQAAVRLGQAAPPPAQSAVFVPLHPGIRVRLMDHGPIKMQALLTIRRQRWFTRQVHCYRMLGSLQDAEDALQDTLLAAWQGLAGFEGRAL